VVIGVPASRDDDGCGQRMTPLAPSRILTIGTSDLEYRMLGPAPDDAPNQ